MTRFRDETINSIRLGMNGWEMLRLCCYICPIIRVCGYLQGCAIITTQNLSLFLAPLFWNRRLQQNKHCASNSHHSHPASIISRISSSPPEQRTKYNRSSRATSLSPAAQPAHDSAAVGVVGLEAAETIETRYDRGRCNGQQATGGIEACN